MKNYRILAINPGSTSTKIAVYDNEKEIFESTLRHSSDEIGKYNSIFEQYDFRKNVILGELKNAGIDINTFSSIVGRGGLLKPIAGGTYIVDKNMLEDLKVGILGEHASNLGGIIAYEIANSLGIDAYIVDPVVVDEMKDVARVSGMSLLDRKSIFHALNQKAVARRYADEKNVQYSSLNLIVAHMGGGVSVGAHEKGLVVDVNNALDGEGPFSPERAGGLPTDQLVDLCYSGKYTLAEIKKLLKGEGGLVAYLNTNDGREVGKMIAAENKKAEIVYKALAYQVAKEIGKCGAVLKGNIDAVILTGGLAYDKELISWIKDYVNFLGDFVVYPGEDEMSALVLGGLRVLKGEEEAKKYI
ncbi:MAG: butyrate kinase [Clostridiales bacterium]|nr:MAG: butyrate kinase [Clostridiales bacterium]